MTYNFIQLFTDYGIDYKNIVDGWTNINCPFHDNGTRGYKGGFNLYDGHYYCWNCGWQPTNLVLSKLLNISEYQVKEILSQYSNQKSLQKLLSRKISKGTHIDLPGDDIVKNDSIYKYLLKRRFNPEYLIDTYKIRNGGLVGEYSYRVIIPIYYHNKVVSFQGRSIFSKNKCSELGILRYKTFNVEESIIDPKHILYNLDNCTKKRIVVVEGIFDCWRLGPKNIASTLGTSMSDKQINLLAKRYTKVVFLFDNEKEAQERANKYGNQLVSLGVEVEIFNPEYKHDPGAYTEIETNKVKEELGL